MKEESQRLSQNPIAGQPDTGGLENNQTQAPQSGININDLLAPQKNIKSDFSKFKFKIIVISALFLLMVCIFLALTVISQKSSNQIKIPNPVDIQNPTPTPQEASPESKIRKEITAFKNQVDAINSNSDKLTEPKIDLVIILK